MDEVKKTDDETNEQALMLPHKLPATKSTLRELTKEIKEWKGTPDLRKYVEIKILEKIVKDIVDDKEFRKKVKENFLELAEGAIDKTEMFGVKIGVSNVEVSKEVATLWHYSDKIMIEESEIESIEAELEIRKSALKSRKDGLKAMKLMEINNGTAEKVLDDEGNEIKIDPLDTFDLKISLHE